MFMLVKTLRDRDYILETDFLKLIQTFDYNARLIFQVLIWPIVIIGVIGNSAVLCRIILTVNVRFLTLKPFYRCALLSFASSDLLFLLASGSKTLTTISQNTTWRWKLPNWSCSVIPYAQTVAVFAGSLTLAGIAIDRYRALTPKYPQNEGFKWPYAVFFNFLIWLIAMTASYPVLGMYGIDTLHVIREDLTYYDIRVCSTDQAYAALVYTALFVTIFIPLALIFVAVHVLLALNIWRRQEQSNKSQFSSGNNSQSTEFSSGSNNAQYPKYQPQRPTTAKHIRRKKRTVNVILVLIFAFLIGRLPIWIFLLFKLHTNLLGPMWSYVQIVFSSITFVNAAVDPFLYTFLCETLSLLTFLQSCSLRKKQIQMKPSDDDGKTVIDANPAIIPRGPYNF